MRSAARHRVPGVAALLLALAALVAVVLAVAWLRSPARRVNADFPHAGLDLSIGVGTQCDSTAGPTTCSFGLGETFTLDFKVNTLPADLAYAAYDVLISSAGVDILPDTLVQQGVDVWPSCGFPGFDFTTTPGFFGAACAYAIGASASTYTGVLMHVDFRCPGTAGSGIISLYHGAQDHTNIVDESPQEHGETQNSIETLTINCGNVPTPTVGTPALATPTSTPSAATPTPTPTTAAGATPTPTTAAGVTPTPTTAAGATPTPTFTVTPTPTRRPHHILLGDVDGDLSVDARDALWVLWFDARIVVDVPIPEAADVNGDDIVSARDALLILQFDAGEIELL